MWAVQLCRTACDYHAHNSVYVYYIYTCTVFTFFNISNMHLNTMTQINLAHQPFLQLHNMRKWGLVHETRRRSGAAICACLYCMGMKPRANIMLVV